MNGDARAQDNRPDATTDLSAMRRKEWDVPLRLWQSLPSPETQKMRITSAGACMSAGKRGNPILPLQTEQQRSNKIQN